MRDLIVVGGGLAGLTAAYRLRDRDLLVLEQTDRLGGRVLSHARDGLTLNLGAHMFAGPGSPVGSLLSELGLARQPIQGRLMGISLNGAPVQSSRPEVWPLQLPLSVRARLSLINMGLRLRHGATRMARLQASPPEQGVNLAALAYEDHRSLADYMGPLHPEVATILTAITERSGGDPASMSAGHALRSFTNVWSNAAPGANLAGGSSRLITALRDAIDTGPQPRLLTDARGLSVTQHDDHVVVTAATPQGRVALRARHCIVATPAPVARTLIADLPAQTAAALEQIAYGPFLSLALLVRENGPMPWQDIYAISTPGARFSVMFNQATGLPADQRAGRGSLMLFRGAAGAAEMAHLDEAALADMARTYLRTHFPQADCQIEDVALAHWSHGAPVARPGRAALQPALEQPLGRIALAGDYLESPNMVSAITTADRAVAQLMANI